MARVREILLPWDSQPQEVVRPHPQLPWTFLWNGATPGVNLATGQLAAASGLPVIGQGGRAQDFDASTTVQSFNIALPTTKYCFVVVSAFSKSNTAYRSIIRCNDYGFRYEPSTSFGGYYPSLTHTGVATTNNPAPHGASGFDLRPYVLIASYDGTVLTQYMRWPDGIIEIVTTTCGMSAGTGTLDISSSIGAMVLYGAALMNAPLPDAVCREILARPWRYLAEPLQIPIPVSAGGGTPTLTVPDTSHAHTLDNVVLTSSTALVVQDTAHGHALDAPTLSTGTALTVADAQHAHALGNVTLSTTGATSLTVADLAHGHALDAVVLTSQTDLAAADMAHGHALDNTVLTLGGINLVVAEIMHAHDLDAVALTLDTYLAVADLLHAHTIDNVLVSIPGGTLDLILKILVNRQELNPATGTFTLYDDDGVTVLYTTSAWADAAGTVPYSGGTLRRIDALF